MKNKNYFPQLALVLLLSLSVNLTSYAQIQAPSASPAAFVSQNVGFTKISIDYSSPGVKGRKIFGELLPYGVPWRAGANLPTTIEFSTEVNIAGTTLEPGKYSVFITPQALGPWTIHLNSKGNAIYAYTKDGKVDAAALAGDDAVAIKVTPEKINGTQERLSFAVSAENNKVAKVTVAWENVKLSFLVDTQVDQKLEQYRSTFQ